MTERQSQLLEGTIHPLGLKKIVSGKEIMEQDNTSTIGWQWKSITWVVRKNKTMCTVFEKA